LMVTAIGGCAPFAMIMITGWQIVSEHIFLMLLKKSSAL